MIFSRLKPRIILIGVLTAFSLLLLPATALASTYGSNAYNTCTYNNTCATAASASVNNTTTSNTNSKSTGVVGFVKTHLMFVGSLGAASCGLFSSTLLFIVRHHHHVQMMSHFTDI